MNRPVPSAADDPSIAERALAAARGEQYAEEIDIGVAWDAGAPLPHVLTNGSRTLIVCRANHADPTFTFYGAHEVHNSQWLEELVRINSVHPSHSEALARSI